jgi:ABC-type multidrug transport system ATPase subunit
VRPTLLTVRDLAAHYGRRQVFRGVSFQLGASQSIGVIGANGAGKTTLLRILVGLLTPTAGEVRLNGLTPRDAVSRLAVAYFAGDATLPGAVRAAVWGSLGSGEQVTSEHRRIRTLSRGARQLLGLRTVLGRQPLDLIVLDEPWESLDADAARWLSNTLEAKRDRGAAVVLSSHRLHDLAGVCDLYFFLTDQQTRMMKAHEISAVGPVTAVQLTEVLDDLRAPARPVLLP